MKTTREYQKQLKSILSWLSPIAIISIALLGYQILSPLPPGTTFLGKVMNTTLLINIVFVIAFIIVVFYVISLMWVIIFKAKPKILIESFIGRGNSPTMRITNCEPVNLKDFTVEITRFSDQKEIWNTIKVLTFGNNFLSEGLPEDRTICRMPIDLKIASSVELDNVTGILTDNNPIYRPLNKIENDIFSRDYEIILKISCRPEDQTSSCELGLYYGKFSHTQIKAHDNYARQDNFYWKEEMKKIESSTDKKMKKEREKILGFYLTS